MFIPNIITQNSKHFTYYQLNKRPPSPGQITWLHHFKSSVQVFFSALKNSFNIDTYWKNYADTDISAIRQYWPIILVN